MHPVYHAKITVSTKNFPRSEGRKCGVKGLVQWRGLMVWSRSWFRTTRPRHFCLFRGFRRELPKVDPQFYRCPATMGNDWGSSERLMMTARGRSAELRRFSFQPVGRHGGFREAMEGRPARTAKISPKKPRPPY